MAQRILVINDTEDILEAFRLLLEGEGYEVVLYSYAPHDLEEVRRVRPDLFPENPGIFRRGIRLSHAQTP